MSVTVTKATNNTASAAFAGVPLVSQEWDFRGINPDHLDAILFYERTREDRHLKQAARLLTANVRRNIFDSDADIFAQRRFASKWLGTNFDGDWKYYQIFGACWMCKRFPKPWMELNKCERDEAARRYTANKQISGGLGVFILSRAQLDQIEASEKVIRDVFPNTTLNYTRIIVQVDWTRVGDSELKQILVNLRPPGIYPKKRKTGKRAAIPVHKLKQLAAWRLGKKAKLTYRQAEEKTRTHSQLFPVNCELDLLPVYASAGAWKDAVDAGETFIIRGV